MHGLSRGGGGGGLGLLPGSPRGRGAGMHLRGGRGREAADEVGQVGFRVDPAVPCGGGGRK